ncbi:MAG: hypothetical protein JWN65_263 [Solirubrobacterales bacterium]|nr:hypothetical protein [Solirubrobacterales bacterium]
MPRRHARAALTAFTALAATLMLVPASGALAAPGAPDPAFGGDGYAAIAGGERGAAVLPTPAGAVLVGGGRLPDDPRPVALLTRVMGDGTVDPTFGTNGLAGASAGSGGYAADAVRLADGDIVVVQDAGVTTDGAGSGAALLRFNADGSLDSGFGDNGIVALLPAAFGAPAAATSSLLGSAIAVDETALEVAQHRLVVAVSLSDGSRWSTAVARFTLDGGLDTGFGAAGAGAGTASLPTPAGAMQGYAEAPDVAVDGAGRVVATGRVTDADGNLSAFVARLDADGVVDASFGTGGTRAFLAQTPAPGESASESASAVALQAGGDIFVGGQSVASHLSGDSKGFVARLDDTGNLVTGFGAGGIEVTGTTGESITSLALAPNGDAIAAGVRLTGPGTSDVLVARLGLTGLDASFGTAGITTIPAAATFSPGDVAVAPDGRALVAGHEPLFVGYAWSMAAVDLLEHRTPVNHSLPATSPLFPSVGDAVSTTDGSWHYAEGAATYQWQRCATSHAATADPASLDCATIAGATGPSHTPTADDAGTHLRAIVTRNAGSLSATAAGDTVPVARIPVTFTTEPSVLPAGPVTTGTTLTVDLGAVQGTGPYEYAIRWLRCPLQPGPCTEVDEVDGLADDDYTTVAGDAGSQISANVTVYGPERTSHDQRDPAPVQVVAATGAAPAATASPTVTPGGPVVAGTRLTRAGDGAWDQGGLQFAYRWQRCPDPASIAGCAAIAGATQAVYDTISADAGHAVRLVVTARGGTGPEGTAASALVTVTAPPAPPAVEQPPVTPPSTGVTMVDTTVTRKMPDVRGLPVDAAKAKIADPTTGIGIPADIDVVETIRPKPLTVNGRRSAVGDVSGQSVAPGTPITASLGRPRAIRLVVEAGPKATASNGGASGPVCTSVAAIKPLKRLGVGEVIELLKAKRCNRVAFDFTVSSSAKEVEVRSGHKDGKLLELQVVVPSRAGALDLTLAARQGAYTGDPTFSRDDWALTADTANIFGISVVNRAGQVVDGAEVLVDASNVGTADRRGAAGGGLYIAGGFTPSKAGTVNVLAQQQDARGNRVFGFMRFKVIDRKRDFTALDGRRFTAGGDVAKGKAARAAGFGDLLAALGRLAQDIGGAVAKAFSGPLSEQTISTAAKQKTGIVQLSLGELLGGSARVVAAGGGNVIAAGGGNVVAAGGGNVIAAGGGNAISLAQGNVIAAGGGNAIGRETVRNGTGSLLELPVQLTGGGQVIAAGGGNVIAAGGGNVIAAGGGNVIAAGGGN